MMVTEIFRRFVNASVVCEDASECLDGQHRRRWNGGRSDCRGRFPGQVRGHCGWTSGMSNN